MVEHVVIDVARRLRSTMAVIDANEGALQVGIRGAQRPGFHLTVVLQQVIGLDHGHRKLAGDELPGVLVPQEPVLPAGRIHPLAGAPVRRRRRTPARSIPIFIYWFITTESSN